MIRDVHPGSRIRILIFLPIPGPESRGQEGTGSESSTLFLISLLGQQSMVAVIFQVLIVGTDIVFF